MLFCQIRPGKNGKLFRMYKFRSMTNEKDAEGNLLPDEVRLTSFGKKLRATSLDELPELFNILKGDMSIVGPRPQLVRDMVFMTPEQNRRHEVRPGLTGLAQINGRNNITWNQKLEFDIQYIKYVSLFSDLKIVFNTIGAVMKQKDVVREGTASDLDFGDWLLLQGMIDRDEYIKKQNEAKKILGDYVG